MLAQLRIVDYAIIEHVELAFDAGFNAITGETGAGKSIIVGAAGLLRGARASADVVRKGCSEAVIEALFDLSAQPVSRALLGELGLPDDGDELLVRRILSRSGRGRVYVNGALCTVGVLGRLTAGLLDISGQHEYQALADRAAQRAILDAVGVATDDLQALRTAYDRLVAAADALQRTEIDDRQREERIDFLRYQLDELEAAQLAPGEDLELEVQRGRLARAVELREAAASAELALYSESGSACEALAGWARRLGELRGVDDRLGPFSDQLEEARVLVEDAAISLGRYGDAVDVDPARLQQVEERLDLVHRLRRKHGGSVEQILAHLGQMRAELEALEGIDQRRESLEAQRDTAREQARAIAARVSGARSRAAKQLSKQISARLAGLRMEGARIHFEVGPLPPREEDPPALRFQEGQQLRRLSAYGWDSVGLMAATNPGEDPRPVGRVASGGELSRIMLAVRQVLGAHDPVGTSIFDEVDAGIGGAVADVVGRALAAVARHRQVLVVTHLPQVAAYADRHFHVGKGRAARSRTKTAVAMLAEETRVEELARMLAASEVTEQARAHAVQLLQGARRS